LLRVGLFLFIMFWFQSSQAIGQERVITLAVGPELIASGAMKYILPRFSLKHGIKFELVGLGAEGTDAVWAAGKGHHETVSASAVMRRGSTVFYVSSIHDGGASSIESQHAGRFVDWLLSDIGQRTILAFEPNGSQVFTALPKGIEVVPTVIFTGNPNLGETLAYTNCGRCHVVGEKNRMKGLGSTPSFALMRTFSDWQNRFEAFYTLNPHPSFSQIAGVTEPFDPSLPPPIHPLEITLEDLNAILAFVATIEPANLGAPLVHQ